MGDSHGGGTATVMLDGASETITVTEEETPVVTEPTLNLRLRKPRTSREVHWAEGTVDNEGMDKKKSKCCCIYEKPRTFDESSSESDDECEHCRGHVEKKKAKRVKLAAEADVVAEAEAAADLSHLPPDAAPPAKPLPLAP